MKQILEQKFCFYQDENGKVETKFTTLYVI